MSFENLREAILEEAKARAAQLQSDAGTRIAAEEDRIKKRAQALEEEITDQAEIRGQQEARRLHQDAGLRARAAVLDAKQQELEHTRRALVETIMNRDKADTTQLLTSLLRLVPDTDGTLVPGSIHRTLLEQLARKNKLTVARESIPGEGGFVFRGEEAEIDLTIGHLVRELFAKHRSDISRVLFG
jgi:V/A-type H+/Na+-transporting ATPase subunit E